MGNQTSKPLPNTSNLSSNVSTEQPAQRIFSQPSTSANSTSGLSTTASLEPNYEWIKGRRFFNDKDIHYFLPNDVGEVDRLVLQHFILYKALGGNFHAPVKELLETGAKVLDVGCGPGNWTLNMAMDFPNAIFEGIDAVDNFPKEIKPSNTNFLQGNVALGLPYPDATFDFVFQRTMAMSFTKEQWATVMKEILRVLKPGGWIQLVECDVVPHSTGTATSEFFGRSTYHSFVS
ncbi:S-adenosyl-L-methionine-dependent methyltransferase [Endogone sp. FLAS-F59071]|nr:S-adenosyl-L-methionine-dependent methyltransferase [Endogone sp. FLAS-F59071]|eukprot:RUS21692.1 S-adenosyl-L-methionine-dependent methyltransferase [Endogone sp. FLAS-F59071]